MQIENAMGIFLFHVRTVCIYPANIKYLVYFIAVEAIPSLPGRDADSVRTYTLNPKVVFRKLSRRLGSRFSCSYVGKSAAPRTGGSDVAHGPLCAMSRRSGVRWSEWCVACKVNPAGRGFHFMTSNIFWWRVIGAHPPFPPLSP